MRDWLNPPETIRTECADCVAVRFGADQSKTNAVISGKLVVPVEVSGTAVSGQQQVEVAIAIEVSIGQTAPNLRLIEFASEHPRPCRENFPCHC